MKSKKSIYLLITFFVCMLTSLKAFAGVYGEFNLGWQSAMTTFPNKEITDFPWDGSNLGLGGGLKFSIFKLGVNVDMGSKSKAPTYNQDVVSHYGFETLSGTAELGLSLSNSFELLIGSGVFKLTDHYSTWEPGLGNTKIEEVYTAPIALVGFGFYEATARGKIGIKVRAFQLNPSKYSYSKNYTYNSSSNSSQDYEYQSKISGIMVTLCIMGFK